jgi:hypothetical protein
MVDAAIQYEEEPTELALDAMDVSFESIPEKDDDHSPDWCPHDSSEESAAEEGELESDPINEPKYLVSDCHSV